MGTHLLTPREIRLLGKPAVALYRWLKQKQGSEPKWFMFSPKEARAKLGLAERTAKRALAKLRQCGAIEARYTTTMLSNLVSGDTWNRTVRVKVWGSLDGEHLHLPDEKWVSWATNRRPVGRPTKTHLGDNCGPLTGQKAANGGPQNAHLGHNYGPNNNTICIGIPITYNPDLHNLQSKYSRPVNALPAVSAPRGLALRAEGGEDGLPEIDTLNPPARQHYPRLDPLPLPELDLPRKIPLHPTGLETTMSPAEQVKIMLAGYRKAIRTVYGKSTPLYASVKNPETSLKAKGLYPALVKAAGVLCEHGISPGAWAEWYMGLLREWAQKGKGPWSNKFPPLRLIYNADTIQKRRGWFRKAYDGPMGWRFDMNDVVREQLLRCREVLLLNRGIPQDAALAILPEWYQDIRRREIEVGETDPNTYNPRQNKEDK